jgi:hypothetical protein
MEICLSQKYIDTYVLQMNYLHNTVDYCYVLIIENDKLINNIQRSTFNPIYKSEVDT